MHDVLHVVGDLRIAAGKPAVADHAFDLGRQIRIAAGGQHGGTAHRQAVQDDAAVRPGPADQPTAPGDAIEAVQVAEADVSAFAGAMGPVVRQKQVIAQAM